jgi:hypothetical protein
MMRENKPVNNIAIACFLVITLRNEYPNIPVVPINIAINPEIKNKIDNISFINKSLSEFTV